MCWKVQDRVLSFVLSSYTMYLNYFIMFLLVSTSDKGKTAIMVCAWSRPKTIRPTPNVELYMRRT